MVRKQRATASNEFIVHVNDKSGRVITIAATKKRRSRGKQRYAIGVAITTPDDKFDMGLAQDKALGRSKRKKATIERLSDNIVRGGGVLSRLTTIGETITERIQSNTRPFLAV